MLEHRLEELETAFNTAKKQLEILEMHQDQAQHLQRTAENEADWIREFVLCLLLDNPKGWVIYNNAKEWIIAQLGQQMIMLSDEYQGISQSTPESLK